MGKTAKDIMTKNVIVVEEDMKVYRLIELFNDNKIGGVPVVNKDRDLVGIVTKSDVLGLFLDFDIDLKLKIGLNDTLDLEEGESSAEAVPETETEVKYIMTPNPITISEDTPIEKLAEIMIDKKIHRIIIIKDNSIVGIISPIDLLHYLAGRGKNEWESEKRKRKEE